MEKKKLVRSNNSDTYLKVADIMDVHTAKVGDTILDEYTVSTGGKLLAMTHVKTKNFEIECAPGLYNIQYNNMLGFYLEETNFLKENFLEENTKSKELVSKLDKFFNNIEKYKANNIFPKRAFLLWGPPGCSKSATISETCNKYLQDGKTFIINWKTFKYRSNDIFDLLKNISYPKEVEKFIFVLEDIGGTEIENVQNRMADSTLLSILDNIDQLYKVPTAIIATTNFPDSLLENLTNRPSRFDDLIEFRKPDGKSRSKFLEFFGKDKVSQEMLERIKDSKYDVFSIAHIKEVFIRSEINDISLQDSMEEVYKQTKKALDRFEELNKKNQVGFKVSNDDDNEDLLDIFKR